MKIAKKMSHLGIRYLNFRARNKQHSDFNFALGKNAKKAKKKKYISLDSQFCKMRLLH